MFQNRISLKLCFYFFLFSSFKSFCGFCYWDSFSDHKKVLSSLVFVFFCFCFLCVKTLLSHYLLVTVDNNFIIMVFYDFLYYQNYSVSIFLVTWNDFWIKFLILNFINFSFFYHVRNIVLIILQFYFFVMKSDTTSLFIHYFCFPKYMIYSFIV